MNEYKYYLSIRSFEHTGRVWMFSHSLSAYVRSLSHVKSSFGRESGRILNHASKGTGRKKVITQGVKITGLVGGVMRMTVCTWAVSNLGR